MKIRILQHNSVTIKYDDDLIKVTNYFKSHGVDLEFTIESTTIPRQLVPPTFFTPEAEGILLYLYDMKAFSYTSFGTTFRATPKLICTYLSTYQPEDDADNTWRTMAHEIMHVLGLKYLNNNFIVPMDTTLVNGILIPYFHDEDPNYPSGNYSEAWKLLQPYIISLTSQTIYPVLRIGSTGSFVKILQTDLNKTLVSKLIVDGQFGFMTWSALKLFQTKNNLVSDGICGAKSWAVLNGTPDPKQAIKDTITKVCTDNGVEPLLGIAVATAESSLNPKATLYNRASNSTDRGLFMWNNVYHPEVTDAMAFDPAQATQLFCNAVKNGHLVAYWSASEVNWKKLLTPEIITKYNI